MELKVVHTGNGHRLDGGGPIDELANRYLTHLATRGFSPGTIRGYAYDLLNFGRFLAERGASVTDVVATDLFDYLDWQGKSPSTVGRKVVRLSSRRGAAPATMNRRIAAVRGLFEYAVIAGTRDDNPVPAARRATGLRPKARGMLGHIGPRKPPTGGRLVRQARRLCPRVSMRRRSPRSSPTSRGTGTGRWHWRWCSVGCGQPRSAPCGWPTWTWGSGS